MSFPFKSKWFTFSLKNFLYLNLNKTSEEKLETLFNAQEIYASTIYSEGNMHGFTQTGSSWGTIFYYVQGSIKNNILHNSVSNYAIVL